MSPSGQDSCDRKYVVGNIKLRLGLLLKEFNLGTFFCIVGSSGQGSISERREYRLGGLSNK